MQDVQRGPIARLLFGRGASQLTVSNEGLLLTGNGTDEVLLASSMREPARAVRGWVWSRLEVKTVSGSRVFRGFSETPLPALADALNVKLGTHVRSRLAAELAPAEASAAAIGELLSLRAYARASLVAPVLATAKGLQAPPAGVLWDQSASRTLGVAVAP